MVNGIWKFGSKVNDDGFENTERKDYHIVAIDYGAKRNILRNLAQLGAEGYNSAFKFER